jgi:flagellin-like hook-associated protein FlgL
VLSDSLGNITRADHVVPVPLLPGFSVDDAMAALQNAMSAAKFVTRFTMSASPTLSVAGNNVGLQVPPVQSLLPNLPIPVGAVNSFLSSAVALGGTQINLQSIGLPGGNTPPILMGATYLPDAAARAAYMSSNPTTPAFCVLPMSGPQIAPGTTIQSVTPVVPSGWRLNLSAASPVLIPTSSQIEWLIPLPATPIAIPTIWGGAEGAIATVNSAFLKTGDMGQKLGNAINSLQQAQDHTTQAYDILQGNISTLTDADLGKVDAQMESLKIKVQLATQSLALGNQWPNLLLQLFK